MLLEYCLQCQLSYISMQGTKFNTLLQQKKTFSQPKILLLLCVVVVLLLLQITVENSATVQYIGKEVLDIHMKWKREVEHIEI